MSHDPLSVGASGAGNWSAADVLHGPSRCIDRPPKHGICRSTTASRSVCEMGDGRSGAADWPLTRGD